MIANKHGHDEKSEFPIDIVRLDPGVRLLFAVYDPAGGLPASKILGETRSTSARLTLPIFNPAPRDQDFMIAIANVGTETVRLRGGSDQIRPLAGNPASPQLLVQDGNVIGPGAMAILNLKNLAGLWAGVTVHFDSGSDVKITWGIPGMILSPMLLVTVFSLAISGCVVFLLGRTLRKKTA